MCLTQLFRAQESETNLTPEVTATAGGQSGSGPQRTPGELDNIFFLTLTHKFLPYVERFVVFNVFTPAATGWCRVVSTENSLNVSTLYTI